MPAPNAAAATSSSICEDAAALSRALPFANLIFARQKLLRLADLPGLDPRDRITPDPRRAGRAGRDRADAVRVRRTVAGIPRFRRRQAAGRARARSFGNALRPALRKANWLTRVDDPTRQRLHVVFLDGDHAVLATSHPRDSSPWPLGIPRLRMHADAPSRSALKLEEAFLTLLDDDERDKLVRDNMQAADLGAAPGGWTWVLVRNGMKVTSVDNGPLAQNLLDSGRVDHLRVDGFQWQPKRTLDWMVCDMVESPRKVADRMATWFQQNWCRQAIFNLKLPMKKRWEETRICLEAFEHQAHRPMTIRARQLYHDREEITVFATASKTLTPVQLAFRAFTCG